jgi:hypothetical protein
MTAESSLKDEKALAVLRARAQLTANLDALEYKLNVPAQMRRARKRLDTFASQHPAVVVCAAAGALAVVVGSVWAGIRLIRR